MHSQKEKTTHQNTTHSLPETRQPQNIPTTTTNEQKLQPASKRIDFKMVFQKTDTDEENRMKEEIEEIEEQ